MPDIVKGSKKRNPFSVVGYVDGGTSKPSIGSGIAGAAKDVIDRTTSSVKNVVDATRGTNGYPTFNPSAAISGAIRGGVGGQLPDYGNRYQYQQVKMPADIGDLPTYDSSYMDTLNKLARELISMNYDDWTKGDQYQSLANRYGENGRMSMQDVLGQVASRTGGLASSYAATAAQQQYNQYMAQLEEVARQMYSQDRSDLLDNANLYRNLVNDEYDRYRDSLSDYNTQKAAAIRAAGSAYGSGGSSGGGESSIQRLKSQSGTQNSKGVSDYSATKNNILMYASRGMDSVANRIVAQVWDQLTPAQQKDLANTLEGKGWKE